MKEYADEGKHAAPRWLAYPQLDAFTIGWRMGYGEDYAMNEPVRDKEFHKLFPKPQNWMIDLSNLKFESYPFFGYFWNYDGKPKYSKLEGEPVEVNDFITLDGEGEFVYNAYHFTSLEKAILFSKCEFFRPVDPFDYDIDELRGYEFTDEENAYWENFKYSVCLNAAYYKIMEDENLKEKLLETGDKPLVYMSDDEWGGEENLFGFALMELRDEIRRLFKNADLIDWEYTEYLKHKNPYETPKPKQRDPEDQQSPEYMVVESTLRHASKYVRDVNLKPELASKYEIGQIITEKAFVDASDKIGGMVTTHRYLILSGYMADFSQFEEKTGWGLHVANRDSSFKVMDVYEFEGKTQIILLQLPDSFEKVFEVTRKMEKKLVSKLRHEFEKTLEMEPILSLTSDRWLDRCSFPLGMSDEGEFYQ